MGFLDEVRATVKEFDMIETGSTVLVGVSGGPDSVALLHALVSLKDEFRVEFHVAHLNHGIRGEEAERDARYVYSLASSFHIPFTQQARDVRELARSEGLSEEQVGRRERYRMFAEVAEEIGASSIALGHNKDDQAETVLMRFLRGSGVEGLAGIPPVRPLTRGVKVIRPLINVARADIEEYCGANRLEPVHDKTNLESYYLRNRIRQHLIPMLSKEYNPSLCDALVRTSGVFREDASYLEMEAARKFDAIVESGDGLRLPVKALVEMHPALRRRVLRKALREARGDLQGIQFVHVKDIEDLVLAGKTGLRLDLPGDVSVHIDYDMLSIRQGTLETGVTSFRREVFVPGITQIPEIDSVIETYLVNQGDLSTRILQVSCEKVAFRGYFDYNKMALPLWVRSRLPGDSFKPLGLNGTKKVKDFFISEKVPRSLRRKVPILVSGQDIVWVVGFRTDERFKVTEETERVLVVMFKPRITDSSERGDYW